MINVGLIGLGGMGRTHFNCYQHNPDAHLVAVCDVDPAKLRGDWSGVSLNLDDTKSELVDLSGIATYQKIEDILSNPDIDMIDICLPTPLHAEVAIAAMRAGKHVFCEKPMAMNADECNQMEAVAAETGKKLMIGHCLRYWPEYVAADEIIRSGQYGRVLSAQFHRSSGMPFNSFNNWMAQANQSGGAVLDMHIHDVDTALWWFGTPDSISVDGVLWQDLPLSADAIWRYKDGPLVTLHGAWDPHGGPFRMAFRVVMAKASLIYDSATNVFRLLQATREGDQSRDLDVPNGSAYQNEIDDFVASIQEGRDLIRVTPASSRLAVTVTRQEMEMIAETK